MERCRLLAGLVGRPAEPRATMGGLVLACMLGAACGDGSSTVVGPTPPAADVGGAWRGTGLVTSVDGGGCVGNVLAGQIGSGDGTPLEAAIDQIGTRLAVTITNGVNQERCAYEGTIAGDSITASMTSCTPEVLALGPACAPAGDLREWMKETLSVRFSGTVDGDELTGTASETAKVTSGDESHEVGLAIEVRLMR